MKKTKEKGLSFISFIIILLVLLGIVYISFEIYQTKMNDTDEPIELPIPPQRAK